MDLTRSLVETKAREYRDLEPLSAVEEEHLDMLPGTFSGEEFGWRDVEWVVQWYFRRYLGAYPDEKRRVTEESFRQNDYEAVVDVLAAVEEDRETADRLHRLTTLVGVDVPVATAFLAFMIPDRYVVLGDREWQVLHEAGELDHPYPDPPTVDDYLTYHDVCRDLTDRFDVDAWTLYRALWRLWKEGSGADSA